MSSNSLYCLLSGLCGLSGETLRFPLIPPRHFAERLRQELLHVAGVFGVGSGLEVVAQVVDGPAGSVGRSCASRHVARAARLYARSARYAVFRFWSIRATIAPGGVAASASGVASNGRPVIPPTSASHASQSRNCPPLN